MRGDFSRLTFRPERHYSGVRLQQGRVQLDSEFNEHVDIEAARDRETALDVIGQTGVPHEGGGFRVGIASMLRGVAAPGALWAVGEDGAVLRAAAGASEWTLEARPAGSGRLNGVHFANDTTGWAVGDGAAIYRLGGAPAVKEAAPSGVVADLHDVFATSATDVLAVGAAGTVLGLSGTTWTRQATSIDVTATLRGVHAAGANACAVGDDGTIVARGGVGWSVESAPPDTPGLHGVFVRDAQHRWAVGEQGTILFSNGAGWSRQPVAPSLTSTLRAVVFTSASTGYAVGDGGTIATTSDGGVTWTSHIIHGGPTADLHDIVATGTTVIAVGDDIAVTRGPGGAWEHTPQLPTDGVSGGRKGRTLLLSAGDLYVDGIRCVNERTVSLGAQPEPPLDWHTRNPGAPGGSGTFGVYLQVQEEHLTAVEREELREVALGGPDTATRTRTVWQAGLVSLIGEPLNCTRVASFLQKGGPRGWLRARAKPSAVSTNSCIVPPAGGYERLENQLYRVEIHERKASGTKVFKWSRDNASMVARLESIETKPGVGGAPPSVSVTVSQVGRDTTLGFGPEQLVEITDEGRMLRGQPGILAEIGDIEGHTLFLENPDPGSLTLADFPDRPLVRRWDGRGDVKPQTEEIELESGVCVTFAEREGFRPGDYWTIPARTLTGTVLWPEENGVPAFEEPHGPELHSAGLALATLDTQGTWTDVRDCRKLFPPLTDLVHMYYVGGDGQEVMPAGLGLTDTQLTPLPELLEVGVANGAHPVAGARVRFEIIQGSGTLQNVVGAVERLTDPSGVAQCQWSIASNASRHRVVATLVSASHTPHLPIVFNATRSVATSVRFYPPQACQALNGKGTVQDALIALAGARRLMHVAGDGQQGPGGAKLPHPLEVAVVSDCGTVTDARVRFSNVAGAGSGALSPRVPDGSSAAPGPDGVIKCDWTLDTAPGAQQVEARLLGVDGTPLGAPVRFDATISAPAAGCSIVITPEMPLVKVIKEHIERGERRLCLCLTPGEHAVEDWSELEQEREFSLELAGCAAGTRLHVSKPLAIAARTVTISDLDITLEPEAQLLFTDCDEITIDGCSIEGGRPDAPLCVIDGGDRIALRGNRIAPPVKGGEIVPVIGDIFRGRLTPALRDPAPQLAARLARDPLLRAQALSELEAAEDTLATLAPADRARWDEFKRIVALPDTPGGTFLAQLRELRAAAESAPAGIALALIDAKADALLTDNVFDGDVVLYGGSPGATLAPGDVDKIRSHIGNRLVAFVADRGVLHLRDNRLTRLALSDVVTEALTRDRDTADRISGVFASIHLTGNVFLSDDSSGVLAQSLLLTANEWRNANGLVAAAIAVAGVFTGNCGEPETLIDTACERRSDAGNLIQIVP